MRSQLRTALLGVALWLPTVARAQTAPTEPLASDAGALEPTAVAAEGDAAQAQIASETAAEVSTNDVEANAAVAPQPSEAALGEETLSDSDVLAELATLESGGVQRGVSFSGFMDFNYRHAFKATSFLKNSLDRNESFYLGNINLYIRGNITAQLRSLVEVRFTYAPNGTRDPLTGGDYTRTLTADYADFERPNKLGSIEIERAHGEYEFAQWLTARVGQFLTPYGIWNVDHGSPTVITITVPYAVGQGMIPERQTGIELFGSYDPNDRFQLQYHLTLSNGRGPFDSHLDLDRNKAVGGRLRLATQQTWGDLSVGFSTYYGRYTNKTGASASAPARIINQRDELALAGDLKWTFRGIHLQGELVQLQNVYTERGRAQLVPDRINWGTYVLGGYRIERIELMPFVKFERQDDEYLDLHTFAYGLNYRPLPELVLKLVGTHGDGDYAGFKSKFVLLDTQIAWAF